MARARGVVHFPRRAFPGSVGTRTVCGTRAHNGLAAAARAESMATVHALVRPPRKPGKRPKVPALGTISDLVM